MLQLTSLNILDKWREITILQQNLLTEELLPPVTTVLGLVSSVQGEGHVYSRDTDLTRSGLSCSSLGYSYPRFRSELVLCHRLPNAFPCAEKEHQNSGSYFSEQFDVSPYLLKCLSYRVSTDNCYKTWLQFHSIIALLTGVYCCGFPLSLGILWTAF